MYKSGRVNIIIDGVDLKVPIEILDILPTTNGMKDTRVYETGETVTYDVLEPLICELLDDCRGRYIIDRSESWGYYVKFLHKYVEYWRTVDINYPRQQKICEDLRREFYELIAKTLKPSGTVRVFYEYPGTKIVYYKNNILHVNLTVDGCVYVSAMIGMSIYDLYEDFIDDCKCTTREELEVLGIDSSYVLETMP